VAGVVAQRRLLPAVEVSPTQVRVIERDEREKKEEEEESEWVAVTTESGGGGGCHCGVEEDLVVTVVRGSHGKVMRRMEGC